MIKIKHKNKIIVNLIVTKKQHAQFKRNRILNFNQQ